MWWRLTLTTTLLLAWFTALLAVRAHFSGGLTGLFLIFNLFLAGVPLVAAWAFERVPAGRRLARAVIFGTWLLFLPNAPYLGTDLLHLQSRPPKVDGICDRCGSTLMHRSDDTVEAFRSRMDQFFKTYQPVREF